MVEDFHWLLLGNELLCAYGVMNSPARTCWVASLVISALRFILTFTFATLRYTSDNFSRALQFPFLREMHFDGRCCCLCEFMENVHHFESTSTCIVAWQ